MINRPALSIAVLPFVNMSGSEDTEYFSDGMTEEIINALAKINVLKVTSRTSSFFFKNKNLPIGQIGQELNVSIILEGSVRLSGNKMRITAQLIDVLDDFHFWSETFDRSMEDVFAVQDEVSLLIADKLREHVGHFEIGDHLVETPKVSIEAYDKYLKGRYHLMKLTLSETLKGIAIFEEVIAAEPTFALPYLDINQGYALLGTMGQMPAMEAFSKAQPFLEKGIELDPNLPESLLNLAWIACWQHWDVEATYNYLNKALDIRPADNIYLTIANTMVVEGKFDSAHTYIDKALVIDPLSGINQHFKGFIYYLQEKHAVASPFFYKSLRLKPDLPFPHIYIGVGMIMEGKPKEALAYFEELSDEVSEDLTKLGGTTLAHIALENKDEIETGLAKLQAALQTGAMGSAMNFLILCKTRLGQHEEAIDLIEQGIEYRLPLTLLLYTEPLIKSLRSNTRFQALMRKVLGEVTTVNFFKRKYKKSLLDKKKIASYLKQLETLMVEEQPYLDTTLTLRALAEMLDIRANHLSQLLNEGLGKNFSEYINAYRLQAFKERAADPKQQHLTILAMAYDSGFNSKTVFNTFFKKATGKTPRAYWKEVNGQ